MAMFFCGLLYRLASVSYVSVVYQGCTNPQNSNNHFINSSRQKG
jgi:hypothetical protein